MLVLSLLITAEVYVARLSTTNMQLITTCVFNMIVLLPQQAVCEQAYALYIVDVWWTRICVSCGKAIGMYRSLMKA